MRIRAVFNFTILLIFFVTGAAFAQPQVNVEILAEKEVITEKNGQQIKVRVPADEIEPGDVIFYTLTVSNLNKEIAKNLKLEDPIPAGTSFIAGSAYGKSATILFSIDNGNSYKKPALLTYKIKNAEGETEERIATPEKYTHIRWIIDQLPPGENTIAGFKVKVL